MFVFRIISLFKGNLASRLFVPYALIEYASQFFNPSVLKYICDLEYVQRNSTYRIRFIKHVSYPERLAVLKVEPFEVLNFRQLKVDLVMHYTIINNLISVNVCDHFTIRTSSSISTSSSGFSLLKPFCRRNVIANHCF